MNFQSLQSQKHKFSNSSSRYCRSFICYRIRIIGSDTSSGGYNKFNSDSKDIFQRLIIFKKIFINNLIMAFKFKHSNNKPMSEINATPFVGCRFVTNIYGYGTFTTAGVQVIYQSLRDSLPDDQEPLTIALILRERFIFKNIK